MSEPVFHKVAGLSEACKFKDVFFCRTYLAAASGNRLFCNFHSFLTCAETYFALSEKLSSGGYDITVTRRNESIFKVIANLSSYGKKDLNSI